MKPTNSKSTAFCTRHGPLHHPDDVVNDPDLSLREKRAILASWASDACSVEAQPDLREPWSGLRVRYDDVMDALQRLDAHPASPLVSNIDRKLRKRRFSNWRRRPDGSGSFSAGWR